MNIEHISVSRKLYWDQCQQAYKYKYHLKEKSGEPEPFYFVYGKVIHKIAEDYVGNQGNKTLSESALDVLQRKIPIDDGVPEKNIPPTYAPVLPQDYKNKMIEHLKSVKSITDTLGMSGELEHEFNYDLEPPNNKFVKGFIDRLIVKDDKYFILDYKTTKKGKWRKDSQSILHDLQLRLYARVVQKEFNVSADKIQVALYYLEGGDLVSAKYTDAAILSAEHELLEAYNQIKELHPDNAIGNVGSHCWRCDYKKRCPFYNAI